MIIDTKFDLGDILIMITWKELNKKQYWYVVEKNVEVEYFEILAGKVIIIRICCTNKSSGDYSQFFRKREDAILECEKRNKIQGL